MSHLSITKAHGSLNDILIVNGTPEDHFTAEQTAHAVRRLCDRQLGLGGDGVYFLADSGDGSARAWFFNSDGSPSLLCGNGMRCAGRLLLERHAAEQVAVHTGPYIFTVRDAGFSSHGVRQVSVELPPADFSPREPIVADVTYPFVDRVLPAFHPELAVTAVAVPNSHLIAPITSYKEPELVRTGRRVAEDPKAFPIGANVSFVLPLAAEEMFVATFERGAGLTLSCGSGVSASRATLSRLGMVDPDVPVLVRNPGGTARSWLQDTNGQWQPILEGNATVVYRTELEASAVLNDGPITFEGEMYPAEVVAFAALTSDNLAALKAAGVQTGV